MNAETLSSLYLVAYVVLLVIGTSSTLLRVITKIRAHRALPLLLIRDLVWVGGMAITFLLILFARVYGPEGLRTNFLWIITTSTPAVLAVAVYAFFEVFIIGPSEGSSKRREDDEPSVPEEGVESESLTETI